MAKGILSYLPINYNLLFPDGILLTEPPTPFYDFKDGIKGEQLGIKYTGVASNFNFREFVIKVRGELKPSIEYQGKPITVYFTGLTGTLYQDFKNRGEVKISLYADTVTTSKVTIKLSNKGE